MFGAVLNATHASRHLVFLAIQNKILRCMDMFAFNNILNGMIKIRTFW